MLLKNLNKKLNNRSPIKPSHSSMLLLNNKLSQLQVTKTPKRQRKRLISALPRKQRRLQRRTKRTRKRISAKKASPFLTTPRTRK